MPATSTRWVTTSAIAVGLVAVLAMILATLRDPVALDVDRPEGVVQAYLQAVSDGDREAAAEALMDDVVERCEDVLRRSWRDVERRPFRAELLAAERDGARSEVVIRITEFEDEPPFGGPGDDFTERFFLEETEGRWLIVEAPWPAHDCEGFG